LGLCPMPFLLITAATLNGVIISVSCLYADKHAKI